MSTYGYEGQKGELNMTAKRIIAVCSIFVLPLLILWITRLLLLGGANQVVLQPGSPLVGRISQALTTTNQGVPVPGVDYKIQSAAYFDDQKWAVVSIKGINNTVTDGLVVLQQVKGVYSVVLGPGTSFPAPSVLAMPKDVQQYLKNGGYLYDPVTE